MYHALSVYMCICAHDATFTSHARDVSCCIVCVRLGRFNNNGNNKWMRPEPYFELGPPDERKGLLVFIKCIWTTQNHHLLGSCSMKNFLICPLHSTCISGLGSLKKQNIQSFLMTKMGRGVFLREDSTALLLHTPTGIWGAFLNILLSLPNRGVVSLGRGVFRGVRDAMPLQACSDAIPSSWTPVPCRGARRRMGLTPSWQGMRRSK